MSDPIVYRINYQAVTRKQTYNNDRIAITNNTSDFYSDVPISEAKFTALVKKLFNKHHGKSDILDLVCGELVNAHGFRLAPMASAAVQIDLEGKIKVK